MYPALRFLPLLMLCPGSLASDSFTAEPASSAAFYEKEIQPILSEHCFNCHADGADKGNVVFEHELSACVWNVSYFLES